jgi:hypothetical protein
MSVPATHAVLGEARVRLAKHKRARTEGGGCCRSSRSPTATEKAVLQMDKVSVQRLPTSFTTLPVPALHLVAVLQPMMQWSVTLVFDN